MTRWPLCHLFQVDNMIATERYNRQVILEGFGEAAQAKLLAAKVLVIGAGGLGCPALQYLAAAGIGQIGIADDDTVALSNLHRQILYTMQDIGHAKAATAKKRLKEMNPEIKITAHAIRISRENILDLFKAYDYILDGSDNFDTRYLVNDASALLSKPLIFAAVSGYEGQLAIFNAGNPALRTNYRDLFPVPPAANEVPNCAEGGVIGVLPGILGTMAAAELIKLITGIGEPLLNRFLQYNLLSQEQYIMELQHAEGYSLPDTEITFLNTTDEDINCGLTDGYTEIDATQLTAFESTDDVLLIDVRERHEVPLLDEERYRKVPMSEFQRFLQSEILESQIILICQHGIRSVAAAESLQEKYGSHKKIYSLKGGISRWRNHF